MLITPMPRPDVPRYLRAYVDWYAQSLWDVGAAPPDGVPPHDHVSRMLAPQLDAHGVPSQSIVFDIRCEDAPAEVGVMWVGSADLGFGPLHFLHDLQVHPPYRRRGHAREALDGLCELAKERSAVRGVALNVFAGNTVARELALSCGFAPLSEVLVRRF